MKKIVCYLLAMVALCCICCAYTVPPGTIVYVTPSGEKYHRMDCSYTSTVREMTIEQAEERGYGPCSRCDPDVLTGSYKTSSSESSSGKAESTGRKNEKVSFSPDDDLWWGEKALLFLFLYVFLGLPALLVAALVVCLAANAVEYVLQYKNGEILSLLKKAAPLFAPGFFFLAYKKGFIEKDTFFCYSIFSEIVLSYALYPPKKK